MPLVKKIVFAPFFLVCFSLLCYLIPGFVKSPALILTLSYDSIVSVLLITALCLATGFFFVIFVSLSQDFKLFLLVALISILPPLAFLPLPLNLFFAGSSLLGFIISFIALNNRLKTYLTFQAASLLSSPTRNLATTLVLVISITYYLSLSMEINQNGIQIPDALIEQSLKFSPQNGGNQLGVQLTDQQKQILDQAKKNPKLLEGSGYTLADLMALEQAASGSSQISSSLKETLKKQFQTIIQPYQNYVAPFLAALVFLTLLSIISLQGLLIPLLLYLTFSLLISTGFIKFQTELREIKKLVV